MIDIEIPEKHKDFFSKVSACIKQREDNLLVAFPIDRWEGRGIDIPLCEDGCYLTCACETIPELVAALHSSVLVSEYMAEQACINAHL